VLEGVCAHHHGHYGNDLVLLTMAITPRDLVLITMVFTMPLITMMSLVLITMAIAQPSSRSPCLFRRPLQRN